MIHSFYYGLGLVVITFIIGFIVAKPYTNKNFQKVASTQRKLCISYVVGFGFMAAGANQIFSGSWWLWVITLVLGLLSVGAFLEAMKTLPNAPKDMQND